MLHYPMFKKHDDSFFQSQMNLTDHCIGYIGQLNGKTVLEIGCGNGVQACYVTEKFQPSVMTGIDLNPESIEIARQEKSRRGLENILFHVDDAQKMKHIEEESHDVVINIESAFHYPDKSAFLREIHRILKPQGKFLIADLVTVKNKGYGLRKRWKTLQALNHWNTERYLSEIPEASLRIISSEDITEEVVKAFRNYPQWFRQMHKKGFADDFLFRLFYYVIIQWYIFLLRNRRRYVIFSGVKM